MYNRPTVCFASGNKAALSSTNQTVPSRTRCVGIRRMRSGVLYCVAPEEGSMRAGWYSKPSDEAQTARVHSSNESA